MSRNIIIILGKTGEGKSTLAKMIEGKSSRSIIFDPQWEYNTYTFLAQNYDDVFDYLIQKNPHKFKINFRSMNRHEKDAMFQTAWTLGNVLVVIDEADMYLQSDNKYVDQLVEQGRHRNVSLCFIARRPTDIRANIRALCTSRFTFAQDDPDILRHLGLWGFPYEGVDRLQKVQYPNEPIEGVNYLVVGKKLDEVEFKEAEYMTGKTMMEL